MRAPTAQRYQRPRRREHDHHDQRRAQNQQQQVAELQPASALSLRRAQIANRWEIELGGNASLQQVKQCRDRGGGESQECQRVNEAHVSRRSARPNGMSVWMWWYAMPCRRQAFRHAAISRRTVSAYARANSRGRTTTLTADSGSLNRTSGGPLSSTSAGSMR